MSVQSKFNSISYTTRKPQGVCSEKRKPQGAPKHFKTKQIPAFSHLLQGVLHPAGGSWLHRQARRLPTRHVSAVANLVLASHCGRAPPERIAGVVEWLENQALAALVRQEAVIEGEEARCKIRKQGDDASALLVFL